MMLRSGGVCSFIVCVIFAVSLTASASDGSEIFVVPANINGAVSYLVSNGDGTFSSQQSDQSLESASAGGISSDSYGNGIGDFDNDGDLDYIMASGFWGGSIYLFEKLGPGNQFQAPVTVAEWSLGFFPMDMAVADFDGDGNLDFVMSQDASGTCGLYLGHGDLSFTYTPLPDTAPMFSSGADAADFNNDGYADFVIAPSFSIFFSGSSNHVFYVNLGNGDGTFDTLIFDSYDLSSYDGVAAADFNHDGNVDLAAASSGYLDIYTGNGDGTFGSVQRYEGQEHSNSPLDNDDFDGDGIQDLVAASFGVAVYMGNGDGTFTYSNTYGDESNGQLWSVSAAPFIPNIDPVAVAESAYPDVSVGEAIEFYGAGSWDEDGEIASYAWEFGDETPPAEGETVGHTYSVAGAYTVNLTVTDDRGATASATTEITVVEAQPAAFEMLSVQASVRVKIKFSPGKLDLKGKGKKNKWIKAKIKLPKGYDARKIDLSSVCIFPAAEEGTDVEVADTDPKHGLKAKKSKKNYKSKKELTVKFDRQAVRGLIENPSKKMIMKVQGDIFHNGKWIEFSGAGKLKIKMKKGKGKDK
jgi:PKD repeat protein